MSSDEAPEQLGPPWTVQKLLRAAASHLAQRHIDRARLESELLLGKVLGRDRLGLYLAHDMPVDDGSRVAFRELVRRRSQHEPVAYLLGEREFFGRAFRVDPRCLIPRPETEHLVDAAIEILRSRPASGRRVLDVGTGSGCVAVTLALEVEDAEVHGTDVSPDALEVAVLNAQRWLPSRPPTFHRGDLFVGVRELGPFDLIVSNPPYITRSELAQLPKEVLKEPRLALDSGDDPLAFHRRLMSDGASLLAKDGAMIFELPDDQGPQASALARSRFPRAVISLRKDLRDVNRLLVVNFAADDEGCE